MSSPLNFELSISRLVIPNYSGVIKCALVLANFSTTVSIPSKPLHLVNLKMDLMDKLYLSVFTQSSEVGCLEIPYSSFSSGSLDQTFKLYENSISPEKERGQLRPTGEVHLIITKLEEICERCEVLEKLVREIKVNIDDIEETSHNHPPEPQPMPIREDKKASVGIKKSKNKALRSGKPEIKAEKSVNKSQASTSRLDFNKNSMSLNTAVDSQLDLKKMLEESYKSRQDLQMSVAETTEQLAQTLKEQRGKLEEVLTERGSAMDQMIEMKKKIVELEEKLEKVKNELEEKKSEADRLRTKANCNEVNEKKLSHATGELENAISENEELEKKLQESIGSFKSSNNTLNKRIEELTADKKYLQGKLEEIIKQNHSLKQENDRYTNLVNELCAQIALLQAELQAFKARENREKHLQQQLKDEQEASKVLKKELDALAKQYMDQSARLSAENSRLQSEKANSDKAGLLLKKDLEKQTQSLLKSQKDLEKSLSDLAALEQHLCVTEDLNKIIDSLSKQNSDSEQQVNKLSNQNANMLKHIESQEEELRFSAEKINELENIRLEREEQLANLENILDELRKDREIYRPNKDDPIDIALSDYVNTRPVSMKVQFDREDQGIYNYGTKKIFVKLEQGKLLIRVGGGYMQVEDFVKLYSPIEIERFGTQKKEQAQKVRQSYLGKYADSLVVNKNKQEMSPERAIKLMKDQMASGSYTPYYAVQMKSPERSMNKSPVSTDRISRGSSN